MTRVPPALLLTALLVPACAGAGSGATLLLPQDRKAFFCDEPIELAVCGLPAGEKTSVELVAADGAGTPVALPVTGAGSTVILRLPPLSLAPGVYSLRLAGAEAARLTVVSGVRPSTLLLSQTSLRAPAGGANFAFQCAFEMGLLDDAGRPLRQVRGRHSRGLQTFEEAVAANLPSLVYQYWTGYVTHKPFGTEKSWASPDVDQAMRLLSFATGQRLRRFSRDIISVGALDEPGLSWGETPAGGSASGFPNWNERAWYEKRGWAFTLNIAARGDADWLKYMALRTNIIREGLQQAREDLRSVCPGLVFANDLYAPHAIMDGTDPWAQQVNDIPTTHVFFDFSGGVPSVPGQMYLEKSYAPTARLAHAMNGQLTGVSGARMPLYHELMNAMCMTGLRSNWWLNTGEMTAEDLEAVNEPAARLGPLLGQFAPAAHDVAILWSRTELEMREMEMAAREAARAPEAKLTVPVPVGDRTERVPVETNAYEVGGAYTRPLIDLHQALLRAGYPTHILHERLLPTGVLRDYRVLFINGQTHDLPAKVTAALQRFVRGGGTIIHDRTSTATLPDSQRHDADLSSTSTRAREVVWKRAQSAADTPRQASVYDTIRLINQPVREAVPELRRVLQSTAARPALLTDDRDLLVERHVCGDAAVIMALNVREEYPDLPPDKPYPRYNPAATRATFTLGGVRGSDAVFEISGLDWRTARRLTNPAGAQTAAFDPGEMKLYLVAPEMPSRLQATARPGGGGVAAAVTLAGARLPYPLTVTLVAPDGRELYRVRRATDGAGYYAETFPLGANAPAGEYAVAAQSELGSLEDRAACRVEAEPVRADVIPEAARALDEAALRAFLAAKPAVTITTGDGRYEAVGQALAATLTRRGLRARVAPDAAVLRKVAYPRVWSPYAMVASPVAGVAAPAGDVKLRLKAGLTPEGLRVETEAGQLVEEENWRQPGALVSVVGEGLVDWLGQDRETCYQAGVMMYVSGQGQVTALNAQTRREPTTTDFRRRWARPWTRLQSYVGNFQLAPQLPEAYTTDGHLIVLGDSSGSLAAAVLQASELLWQTVDEAYPGPGRALLQLVRSPFAVGKEAVYVGAADEAGLRAGARRLLELGPR